MLAKKQGMLPRTMPQVSGTPLCGIEERGGPIFETKKLDASSEATPSFRGLKGNKEESRSHFGGAQKNPQTQAEVLGLALAPSPLEGVPSIHLSLITSWAATNGNPKANRLLGQIYL